MPKHLRCDRDHQNTTDIELEIIWRAVDGLPAAQEHQLSVHPKLLPPGEVIDDLFWLGAYCTDRAKHAVRLVQLSHRGRLHYCNTNFTDRRQLRLHDSGERSARRWDKEMTAQLVKEHLGLHLWWSSKPVELTQQL